MELTREKRMFRRISKLFCILLGVIMYVLCAMGAFFQSDKSLAEDAAKSLIAQERLNAPSSAVWNTVEYLEDDGNGKFIIYIDVQDANELGGVERTKYFVCVYKDADSDNFSYNELFSIWKCSGKNDDAVLNLLKGSNEYAVENETTEEEKTEENAEADSMVMDAVMITLLLIVLLFGGYVILYFLLYQNGKLQKWKPIFEPFDKIVKEAQEKKQAEQNKASADKDEPQETDENKEE